MSLREYCSPDAILCNMEAGDKDDALQQLVDALAGAKAFPKTKVPTILAEVVERERQATTGIGKGIGIPHARSPHAKKLALAIGRVDEGLEYGAVDGERVRTILLLISPKDAADEHLAAMRSIVKIARDPYQRARLHSCDTPESFLELLAEVGG
jgi:mannitol/fructose-specific phosphotransferase system IIA component (Ntr-type)